MAGIALEGVSKVYDGGVRAVNGVDLEIADGEFVVLVGPSGCGKSTLLRMIAGLEHITEGAVWIGDRDVTHRAPRDRDIAMVFQNYALYPQMKVRDNLAFGLKLRRTPKAERDARVAEVAQVLGLEDLLDRKPGQLSGGQRQRVAMGRAMVREPAAYLMDEPLSNLDAKLRVTMRAELARLHERLRTTTVYVTHDQVEAMTLGERVVVLRDGVVQQIAPPAELYRSPANLFVAAFIGSPQMNLLECAVEEGAVIAAGARVPVRPGRIPAGTERVVLGFRPADLDVAAADDPRPALEGPIAVYEDLGSEAHAIVSVAGTRVDSDATRAAAEAEGAGDGVLLADDDRALVTAKVDSRSGLAVGATVHLAIDPERIHLFDGASGAALT
jgi:multiple sugar transport system ATP-binding protein